MLRGDVYRFKVPKGLGHEQRGERFGVVVQADELLPRSVVLVAPTSRSARGASFRPEIEIEGELTKVLVEQVGAVDLQRLEIFPATSVAKNNGASTTPSSPFSDSVSGTVRSTVSLGRSVRLIPGPKGPRQEKQSEP